MSPSKESVFVAGLLSQALGVVHQDLGLFLGEVHEVGALDLEDMVDEPYKGRPVSLGGRAFKMTQTKQDNTPTIKLVKLSRGRQRLHGVLLRCGARTNLNLVTERCFCSSFLLVALPR